LFNQLCKYNLNFTATESTVKDMFVMDGATTV